MAFRSKPILYLI